MPKFTARSLALLDNADVRLRAVCVEAIQVYDFTVLESYRDREQQEKDFARGASKLQWPNSPHNKHPARAVDLAPFPVDWSEGERPHLRFAFLAGVMFMAAHRLGVTIRWGGDFNRNLDPRDDKWQDLPHFEVDEP